MDAVRPEVVQSQCGDDVEEWDDRYGFLLGDLVGQLVDFHDLFVVCLVCDGRAFQDDQLGLRFLRLDEFERLGESEFPLVPIGSEGVQPVVEDDDRGGIGVEDQIQFLEEQLVRDALRGCPE